MNASHSPLSASRRHAPLHRPTTRRGPRQTPAAFPGPLPPLESLPGDLRFSDRSRRADLASVVLVSVFCGLYFGMTCGWQIAVESAQAVAGLVDYPPENPFYMYHVKSWTLLHQVPAVLLRCGVSEAVVSLAIACFAAVLCLTALALWSYAISGDRLVASLTPLICVVTNVCKECGGLYPIHLYPRAYWMTYGVTGTGYVLCTWALLGLGFRRPVALLCGLAPALHPSLGAWCMIVSAVSLAWDWRRERLRAAAMLRWFGLGATLSAVSFAARLYCSRDVPSADAAAARPLVEAFMAGWDNHRLALSPTHVDWWMASTAWALAAVVYAWHRHRLPPASHGLLRVLLITSPGGLALAWLTHLSDWLPQSLVMAMPGRFINFGIAALPALLIGLLARWRRSWPMQTVFAGLMLACLLRALMLKTQWFYVPAAPKLFSLAGLAFVYICCASRRRAPGRWMRRWSGWAVLVALVVTAYVWRRDWRLAAAIWTLVPLLWWMRERFFMSRMTRLRGVARLVALGCASIVSVMAISPWLASGLALANSLTFGCNRRRPGVGAPTTARRRTLALVSAGIGCCLIGGQLIAQANTGFAFERARRQSRLWSAASHGTGLILTAPRVGIAQLLTRRGVVINAEAINQITYIPDSALGINHALRRLYGDDLLAPRPVDWLPCGGLMSQSGRSLWEARDADDWRALAHEFGFGDILTPGDWKLRLPAVARDGRLVLYHVPEN
jgi:hypothetical protein